MLLQYSPVYINHYKSCWSVAVLFALTCLKLHLQAFEDLCNLSCSAVNTWKRSLILFNFSFVVKSKRYCKTSSQTAWPSVGAPGRSNRELPYAWTNRQMDRVPEVPHKFFRSFTAKLKETPGVWEILPCPSCHWSKPKSEKSEKSKCMTHHVTKMMFLNVSTL